MHLPAFRTSVLAFFICLMSLSTIAIRWKDYHPDTATTQALEASYHTLFMIEVLRETPASDSKFLPLVSFPGEADRNIPWGTTLRTRDGRYIYASFESTAFLPPLAFFELFGLPTTLQSILIFNGLLQLGCCFVLAFLLRRMLAHRGLSGRVADIAVLAGVSIQFFAQEALISYGLIYWTQQFYQLVMIGSLVLLHRLFAGNEHRRRTIALLLGLAFAGPLIEWTAFVFNAGMVLVLLHAARSRGDGPWLKLAIAISVVTLVSAIAIIAHFAWVSGLQNTLDFMSGRFLIRSGKDGDPYQLAKNYVKSFGLILPIFIGSLVIVWQKRAAVLDRAALLVLFVSLFALLENILLMQHSTQFGFDRLKMIIPMAIVITYAVAIIGARARLAFAAVLAVALLQNIVFYWRVRQDYAAWPAIAASNRALAGEARRLVADDRCALIASGKGVRGFTNLTFKRSIWEWVERPRFLAMLDSPLARRCGAIYITGNEPFLDLPRYLKIEVFNPGKSPVTLTAAGADRP